MAKIFLERKVSEIPFETFPQAIDVYCLHLTFHDGTSSSLTKTPWTTLKYSFTLTQNGFYFSTFTTSLNLCILHLIFLTPN